ncbi:MAG: hypothetical protein K2X27_04925 [Candidatus Obscuribacterales bacterium]|nr:hypothetical protein [Candidatus Obscuribacterales bacterium]
MSTSNRLKDFSVFAVASILLAACSSGEQVSYQSGGMTHTFKTGQTNKGINFALPVYPNAKASGEVQSQDHEEQNSFLLLSSSDPLSKISEYYLSELKKEGWTITQQQVQDSLANISAKKDKLEGSVMLSADGNSSTTINLSVSTEEEGVPEVSKEEYTPDKLNPPTD